VEIGVGEIQKELKGKAQGNVNEVIRHKGFKGIDEETWGLCSCVSKNFSFSIFFLNWIVFLRTSAGLRGYKVYLWLFW